MTAKRDTLERLGRFLLRGLRIGASTVSIVELLLAAPITKQAGMWLRQELFWCIADRSGYEPIRNSRGACLLPPAGKDHDGKP